MTRFALRNLTALGCVAAMIACATETPRDRLASLRSPAKVLFKRLGSVEFENDASLMCVAGNIVYVGSERDGVIHVFDVTLSDAPESIATITKIHPSSIAFSEDRLFVVESASPTLGIALLGSGGRLATFDVLDPIHPTALETRDIEQACTLAANAARACVGAENRVLVGAEGPQPIQLDVEPGDAAQVVGLGWRGDRIAVVTVHRGSWLSESTAQLTMYRGRRPVRAGTLSLPAGVPITDCGSCLVELTTDQVWIGTGDRVLCIDVSDPAQPKFVRTQPLRGLRGMAISNSLLFTLTDEVRAFRLPDLDECAVGFDIEPKSPQALGMRNGLAYLVGNRGLDVFDVTTHATDESDDHPEATPAR